jgi:hypothetical protein
MSRPPLTSDQGRHILERIRKIRPFLQGSLSITKKRCGNLTCRCVKEGPIHEAALLTWKEGQKTRTLYVPIELRQEVAAWVEEGKTLKGLIAEMSKAQREFLISKKKNMKSSER